MPWIKGLRLGQDGADLRCLLNQQVVKRLQRLLAIQYFSPAKDNA
jgi:hypothetical protein